MKTLGTPMLDGCKCGVSMGVEKLSSVGLGSELTRKEFDSMRHLMTSKLGGLEVKNLTTATVYPTHRSKGKAYDNYTSAKLSCNIWKGRYYLNVEGNPISFLTGQNVLGSSHLARVMEMFYLEIEKAIQRVEPKFSLPSSIVEAIETLNIHVHRLAFACYTPELELKDWRNMSRFFHAIDSIYSGYSDLYDRSVKEFLGLDVTKHGRYSITFIKKDRVSKLWSLALYNKAIELEEADQKAEKWLEKRIRIDLTLHSTWFDRNRCRTLKDIVKKLDGSYKTWVYNLIQECMEETKVQYMLGFKTLGIDPGKYQKQFDSWSRGKVVELTPVMRAWFLEQGLDLSIPLNVHTAAAVQRVNFTLADGTMDRAILGNKEDLKKMTARMEDGLRNGAFLPIAKRAHLITPDTTFGRFTKEQVRIEGKIVEKWVDTDSGEVLD